MKDADKTGTADRLATRLRDMARENRDFDLYEATFDRKKAYGYALDIGIDAGTSEVIRQNGKRRARLERLIETEEDGNYSSLYRAEIEILDTYTYVAILKAMNQAVDMGKLNLGLTEGNEKEIGAPYTGRPSRRVLGKTLDDMAESASQEVGVPDRNSRKPSV